MSEMDASAPALEVRGLSCGYGGHAVLQDVSFSAPCGRAVVLLGPNGVGKTTLFKTVLGFLPRISGSVLIAGEEVCGWSRKRYARSVAYVPQSHDVAFGFTVWEMVLMGRTPALAGLALPSEEDEQAAWAALERLRLRPLADRDCTTLSGGELQMVLIARALAQGAQILMMDEPCANLDLGNQVIVLERVRELMNDGLTVAMTSHDPNHAFLLGCDAVCVRRGGDAGVASGPARDVLRAQDLSALYGVEVGVGEVVSASGRTAPACGPLLGKGISGGFEALANKLDGRLTL